MTLLERAWDASRRRDFREAERLVAGALDALAAEGVDRSDRRWTDALRLRTRVLRALGHLDGAEDAAREALALAERHAPAQLRLALDGLGDVLDDRGDLLAAEPILARARDLHRAAGDAKAAVRCALALAQIGRRLEGPERAVEKLAEVALEA